MFDGNLFLLVAVLIALVVLAAGHGGQELVWSGFSRGAALLLRYGLVIAVSFLAAGFIEVLIPHEWVRRQFGGQIGVRGILIATAAGTITPAGPFVSMPVAAVMLRAGAGPGPVVAFLSAWALLALHRFVAWEVPILGLKFASARYAVCLVLPIVAGLLARFFLR